MPKVSILMTVYNQEKFIGEAIRSVLLQKFSDWELVVMDDCSTDSSLVVAKNFSILDKRVRVFGNQERVGVAKNRNRAFENLTGQYAAILDADDFWTDENKLVKQIKYLDEHIDCVLVSGNAKYIDAGGKVVGKTNFPTKDEVIRKKILSKNVIVHSTVMYRRQQVDDFGRYADLRVGEDYDLWLRLGQIGKFCILSEFLVNYRLSGGQATKKGVLEILRTNLGLVRKYSDKYPGANLAFFRRWIRYVLFWPISKIFVK